MRAITGHIPGIRRFINVALALVTIAAAGSPIVLHATPAAASPQSYTTAVLSDNPSLFWRLDESACCTAADSSGNGNTGTYSSSGITYSAPGALANDSDSAVIFSGIAAQVADTAAAVPATGAPMTVEFWFKAPSGYSTGNLDLYSSTNGEAWICDASTFCHGDGGRYPLPYAINDGAWHLFDVATGPNGSPYGDCKVFLDGAQVGDNNVCGHTATSPGFALGNFGDGTGGSFDEVAVYPTQLSGPRIEARWTIGASHLNQSTLCAPTPTSPYSGAVLADTPSLYLRLDELASDSQGRVAFDASGHCTTGQPTNAAYSSLSAVTSTTGALANDSNSAVTLTSPSAQVADTAAAVPATGAPMTVEFWFKAPSGYSTGNLDLYSSTNGEAWICDASTFCHGDGGRYPLPYAINDGAWHLFDVATGPNGSPYGDCKVFLDGAQVGDNNVCGHTATSPGFALGNFGDGTGGSFDEVAVYPTQLSGPRIEARWTIGASHLNQSTLCAPTPTSPYSGAVLADTPSLYLRLDELASDSQGRVAFDASGHCTTGQPTNAAYSSLSAVTSTTGALANDSNSAVILPHHQRRWPTRRRQFRPPEPR